MEQLKRTKKKQILVGKILSNEHFCPAVQDLFFSLPSQLNRDLMHFIQTKITPSSKYKISLGIAH